MADVKLSILAEFIDKATPDLQKFVGNLDSAGAAFKRFGVGVGATVAAAVVGFAALAKNAVDSADDIGKAAQKMGVSVEFLSGLKFAGELSDVSLEQLTTAFNQLSKSMYEAQDPASAAASTFRLIGVELKDANGNAKSSEQVFRDLAERLSKLPNGADKTALAMKAFGKSGADLIPLLNEGAKGIDTLMERARELGLVISDETAVAAQEFNDRLTELKGGVTGAVNVLMEDLLPTLVMITRGFTDASSESSGFKDIADGIGLAFRVIVNVAAGALFVVEAIVRTMLALNDVIGYIMTAQFGKAKQAVDDLGQTLQKRMVEYGQFMNGVDNGAAILKQEAEERKKRIAVLKKEQETEAAALKERQKQEDEAKKAADDKKRRDAEALQARKALQKAFDDAYLALQKQTNGYDQMSAAQKQAFDIEHSNLKNLSEDKKKLLIQESELKEAQDARLTTFKTAMDLNVQAQMTESDAAALYARTQGYLERIITIGPQAASAWLQAQEALNGNARKLQELELRMNALATAGKEGTKEYKDLAAQLQGVKEARGADAEAVANGIVNQQKLNEKAAFYHKIMTDRSRLTVLVEHLKMLDDLRAANQITADEQKAQIIELTDAYMASVKDIKVQFSGLSAFVKAAAESMQSAMSDFFFDILQNKATSFKESFKRMIDRLVADVLAAEAAMALFGNYGKTGQMGGIAGAAGSFLSGMFRAEGGPVTAGQPYIVGERRAELFIPQTDGYIHPNTDMPMNGASNNITIAVTAMDSQDVMRAMDKIKRPLVDMLNNTSRTYNQR